MTPVTAAMAAVALAAIATGMLVIVLVAVETSTTKLDAVELAGMAGVAVYGAVSARQFKLCILVMVEDEPFPFLLVMTFFAFLTIATAMNVIDAVASYAFPGKIFVAFVWVAAVASSFFVLAVQRKFCLVMVEAAGLPSLDAMTFVAGLT